MHLSEDQQAQLDVAVVYAKENRKQLARDRTSTTEFPPEVNPVSVFMAGSPGAGKTEASIELLRKFDQAVLRIDPDELRHMLPGYTGQNANLFQRPVSILVDSILDRAFHNRQSFILDGTLARKAVARKNIDRSLRTNRVVQILYVYQKPAMAWKFVQARERDEGRSVPVESFIAQYFESREVVNQMKTELGSKIRLDLLLKNLDGTNRTYKSNIEKIDYYIPETYSRRSLTQLLT